MIGFEYFLDDENYILGWAQWNIKNRPDLERVPFPLKEMSFLSKKDSYQRLWTGTHIFKLVDNEIIREEYQEPDPINKIEELEARIEALEKDK